MRLGVPVNRAMLFLLEYRGSISMILFWSLATIYTLYSVQTVLNLPTKNIFKGFLVTQYCTLVTCGLAEVIVALCFQYLSSGECIDDYSLSMFLFRLVCIMVYVFYLNSFIIFQ